MTATFRQSLDDAGRAILREVAPEIVMDFRGEPNRKLSTRKELRWGNKGSLALVIAGSKKGLWFDHDIGRGGDIIDFIKIDRGCSFVDALDHAAQYASELRNGRHSSRPASRPSPRRTVDDDEKRINQALAIWCEARPLYGTIAESYLRSRYIDMPTEAIDVVRFHPFCPWQNGTCPAMVALVRDIITNEPCAVHRTALTVDGRKLDRPKLLGPAAGGAIKLSSDHVTGELTIGEGIETTLSAIILGFKPAWSVIDAGGIAKFPVLPWIKRLTVITDNDISGTGQKAAADALERWKAAGLRARSLMPPTPGRDFNDILMALDGRP